MAGRHRPTDYRCSYAGSESTSDGRALTRAAAEPQNSFHVGLQQGYRRRPWLTVGYLLLAKAFFATGTEANSSRCAGRFGKALAKCGASADVCLAGNLMRPIRGRMCRFVQKL